MLIKYFIKQILFVKNKIIKKKRREQLRGLNNRPEAEILISNAHPRPLCPFIWNIFFSRLEYFSPALTYFEVQGVPVEFLLLSTDHQHSGMAGQTNVTNATSHSSNLRNHNDTILSMRRQTSKFCMRWFHRK